MNTDASVSKSELRPNLEPFAGAHLGRFCAHLSHLSSWEFLAWCTHVRSPSCLWRGDDAYSIAYHLLRRDAAIQPPYSPYNGMLDVVLSFLPRSEAVLRISAITISSVGASFFAVLTMAIVFSFVPVKSVPRRALLALGSLLAIPELFYLGLVYQPPIIAMCFVMASHLVLRCASKPSLSRVLLSILLFAFGVASRWDVVAYGAVIACDLLIDPRRKKSLVRPINRFVLCIGWGISALIASFAAIWMTGSTPQDVFGVVTHFSALDSNYTSNRA